MRSTDPCMLGEPQFERVDGDFYPTPPENLDCLAHYLDLMNLFVWECACGEGDLSKRLQELGVRGVISTDLFDRGYGTPNIDFLKCPSVPGKILSAGQPAIITNPPYGELAEQFIRHALELMKPHGGLVAMFLRNEYDCAKERMGLFRDESFAMKIIVTKRPRWIKGSKGSPRHTYAWYVWNFRKINHSPHVHYIHPDEATPLGTTLRAVA